MSRTLGFSLARRPPNGLVTSKTLGCRVLVMDPPPVGASIATAASLPQSTSVSVTTTTPTSLSTASCAASAPWLSVADSRENSSQSLAPSAAPRDGQRRLLVVYIHGFMGTNTSFRRFPFHVHQYLKLFLDSHVVHTKIYPRYKTYRSLDTARDNLSAWLAPHESDDTDVVLVGHSMGGLLAAEVALMPATSGPYSRHPYKHRILGTISIDAPLLGLHPRIIPTGIRSLFRSPSGDAGKAEPAVSPERNGYSPSLATSLSPSPAPVSSTLTGSPSHASLASSAPSQQEKVAEPDPTFNPTFFNDSDFPKRPFCHRMRRFIRKHNDEGLAVALANHLQSHFEFAGCLLDYADLNTRYDRLRALEDYNDLPPPLTADGVPPTPSTSAEKPSKARIRFVNYYTVSNGRHRHSLTPHAVLEKSETASNLLLSPPRHSRSMSTPSISLSDHSDNGNPDPVSVSLGDQDDTETSECETASASSVAEGDEDEAATAGLGLVTDSSHSLVTLDPMPEPLSPTEERLGRQGRPEKTPKKFCAVPKRDGAWVPVMMGDMDEVEAHSAVFLQGQHYDEMIVDVGARIVGWIGEDLSRRAIVALVGEGIKGVDY